MAGKNARWHQALFPIDEQLIEQLIDDYLAREQAADSDTSWDDADDDEQNDGLVWCLEVHAAEIDGADPDNAQAIVDAAALEDVHAVNMRVLDDYLRRRMIEDPEAVPPTLH